MFSQQKNTVSYLFVEIRSQTKVKKVEEEKKTQAGDEIDCENKDSDEGDSDLSRKIFYYRILRVGSPSDGRGLSSSGYWR